MSEDENNVNGEHFYDIEIAGARERLAEIFQTPGEFPPVNPATLETMYDYLTSHVQFPFMAELAIPDETPPGRQIINVTVNGIYDPDDTEDLSRFGLVCQLFNGEETVNVPLADVVIKMEDPNFQFVEDYCVWYWEVKGEHG